MMDLLDEQSEISKFEFDSYVSSIRAKSKTERISKVKLKQGEIEAYRFNDTLMFFTLKNNDVKKYYIGGIAKKKKLKIYEYAKI